MYISAAKEKTNNSKNKMPISMQNVDSIFQNISIMSIAIVVEQ